MRWLFAERCVVWIAIVFGVSIMSIIIDHPEITVSSRFHPVNSLAPAANAAVLSTPRQQRPLPQRKPREGSHKNGGIILFIHVPKTGGTSFAPSLMSRAYIAYVHDAVPQVLESVKEAVRSPELSVGKHETIFAEVHIPVPALGKFQHQIDTWRDLAASQGIPFFVFSMVRDPIHYAVSWFEFFCINTKSVAGAKAMCGDWAFNDTEQSLEATTYTDPQTAYFTEHFNQKLYHPPESSVLEIWEAFMSNFEWVGRTEAYIDTVHVLETVLGLHPNELANTWRHIYSNRGKLNARNLTEETKALIRERTRLDQELYDKVQATYRLNNLFGED